jgi:hypothetical protein
VPPVKYELGFYIPEDDILHSDRRENLKSYKLQNYNAIHTFSKLLNILYIQFMIRNFITDEYMPDRC